MFNSPVGSYTAANPYQLNAGGQYYINNPSQFADSSFSLF